jgi:hypothetical protein
MPFTENLKSEVKKLAAFRCCRCHEIGIEVHHITPQANGGSDNKDNAAPLCPNCHTNFGGNTERRKNIRQMRDWWYEVVKEKYHEGQEKWEKINNLLIEVKDGNDKKWSELESQLQGLQTDIQQMQNNTQNAIQHRANEYITATRLADRVHANFQCKKCRTAIGLMIGSNECPNCHTHI